MYKTLGKLYGSGRLMSGKHQHVDYNYNLEFQQEVDIGPEEFFAYRMYMPKLDRVAVHIEVLDGNDIDCLVMNEYNYAKYMGGEEFTYILTGSILDVKIVNYLFVSPEDGLYYFVLDNTSFPSAGARPDLNVAKGYSKVLFDVKGHEPLQMVTARPQRMMGT